MSRTKNRKAVVMKINELTSHIEEIDERYQEDTILKRLGRMFRGIRMPRNSKEHKEALIEAQRLSAPVCAVLLPVLVLLLLIVFTNKAPEERKDVVFVIPTDTRTLPPLIEPKVTKKDMPKIDNAPKIEFKTSFTSTAKPVEPPPVAMPRNNSTFVIPDYNVGPDLGDLVEGGIGGARKKGIDGIGPGSETEKSVMLALRWLKKNQNPDGSWNRNKCAMTGLAVLTFLAHNATPQESAEFGATVQKAIEFLMAGQNRETGLYGNQDGHQYSHPIAAYAMCEAYALIKNPNIGESARLAMKPIINGQHPTGGWTYKMDPGLDNKSGKYRDDTSYMGWCAQSLKAAKMAGLKVDGLDKAIKLAVKGFKSNAGPNGGFGYTGPSSTHGLTSVGALCMELLGAGADSSVRKSLEVMDKWDIGVFGERNKVGGSPQYYFYYATQSKFNAKGKRWKNWNDKMVRSYLKAQKIQRGAYKDQNGESHDIGWWENGDVHTDRPVMDTCLTSLQLMVYYRNLETSKATAFIRDRRVLAGLSSPEKKNPEIQVVIEGGKDL